MAIWQFDLTLHPAPGGVVASDGSPAWGDERRRAIEATLDAGLPRGRSWGRDVLTWGGENGGRVDLIVNDGTLVEVSARVDMRGGWRGMLDLLVRLAQAAEVDAFETADEGCIPAGPDSLLAAAMDSRAMRFVRDPEGYLRGLADDPPG